MSMTNSINFYFAHERDSNAATKILAHIVLTMFLKLLVSINIEMIRIIQLFSFLGVTLPPTLLIFKFKYLDWD